MIIFGVVLLLLGIREHNYHMERYVMSNTSLDNRCNNFIITSLIISGFREIT